MIYLFNYLIIRLSHLSSFNSTGFSFFMKFQSLEFFLKIVFINSVNENVVSLDILGSLFPVESQNRHI